LGTSRSYGGPKGPGDLLPPDAPPPPPEPQPDEEAPPEQPPPPEQPEEEDPGHAPPDDCPPGDEGPQDEGPPPVGPDGPVRPKEPPPLKDPWGAAKRAMGKFARSGGGAAGKGSQERAVRYFVRAQGGRGRAARNSPSASASGRNLARFLSAVATRGLAVAAREFNLGAFLDRGIDTFLVALTRVLAPGAGTNEEAAAHAAIAETTVFLFEEYGVEEGGLEALEALDEAMIGRALEYYVAALINTRLMHVLGSRIEAEAQSAEQAVALEAEVKDYVRERVRLNFAGRDLLQVNWDDAASRREIEDLFEEAYGLLEEN
jgi:hypothetical protein